MALRITSLVARTNSKTSTTRTGAKAKRRKPFDFLTPARRRSAAWMWWMLPVTIVAGWFYPYVGFLMLVCMLTPIAVAAVRGRFWCGWVCPRGSFLDYVMGRFSRNKPAPAWMRSQRFRVGALVGLMTLMSVQMAFAWPDPQAIGRVFITLLTVTSLLGVGLALAYKPRTWCSFCPVGTMSNWVSWGKRPLHLNASACTSCSACAKICPMGLTPHQQDSSHAACIKCEQCVTRCPKKALSFVAPDVAPDAVSTQDMAA
jgi:polyferredoxin